MFNENQIRQDQQAHSRIAEGRPTLRKPVKLSIAPKGHEAFLKALESSGATVEFEKASSGEKVVGKIKTSDKYTVSLAVQISPESDEYVTRVLFKHDISEFSTVARGTGAN